MKEANERKKNREIPTKGTSVSNGPYVFRDDLDIDRFKKQLSELVDEAVKKARTGEPKWLSPDPKVLEEFWDDLPYMPPTPYDLYLKKIKHRDGRMHFPDFERRNDPGYEISFKKAYIREMRWAAKRNPPEYRDIFPRSYCDSVMLKYFINNNWTRETYVYLEGGRFAMAELWEYRIREKGDCRGRILWLDESSTDMLLKDFDPDFFSEFFARFGSMMPWNHDPWNEVTAYLDGEGLEYKTVSGPVKYTPTQKTLDGVIESFNFRKELDDEEMLRIMRMIPDEQTQKLINEALKEGTPVAMLYDAIG